MYLIFVLFIGIIGPDALFIYSIGGEPQVDPVSLAVLILSYIGLWVVCFLIYSVIQGIFNYGYSVFTLHLGKQEEVKVDDIFSGFKKKNLFKSIKLGLMQAIFLFFMESLINCSRYY